MRIAYNKCPTSNVLFLAGLGTSENVLIDLAHSHTNEELAAIKDKWETKVRCDDSSTVYIYVYIWNC